MDIEKKIENGKLTLSVSGRLDTNTSPDLEAELAFDGVTEVEFDFSGLEYISSAGLRVIMSAHRAMSACGGTMCVSHPNNMVKSVFDMTGLSGAIAIVP